MDAIQFELSLHQQFELRLMEVEVKSLSPENAQEMLLEVARQLMVKDNIIKQLMKGAVLGESIIAVQHGLPEVER